MKTRNCLAWGMLLPAMCLLILRVPAVAQHRPTITTIDAPGAGAIYGYGTEAIAINPAGVITGYYIGYDNIVHAYVRNPYGKFTTFDGPGVPSYVPTDPISPPVPWVNTSAPGTYSIAIDADGAVTGYYMDANIVAHGFLRAPDGKFTPIDVPGAGSVPGQGQGTYSANMNLEGTIAGTYVDANNGSHGFVRAVDGAIKKFDVPGATGSTWLNWAQCISTSGAIAGTYADSAGVSHGFLRDPDGKITTFEFAATGLTAGQGTNAFGINAAGTIEGAFVDANNVYHGLVRTADGKIAVFDAPGAPFGHNTIPEAIDSKGTVAGLYSDADFVFHGFLRSADGGFTSFELPGAGSQFKQGTFPMFNTDESAVGFWIDSNYVQHGFVLQ